eukprot:TRINITY_DN16431_c0_g1_i2.p1 TRINITY_DN16431_c0_g1~~TRINITY_DN16431_c0_g1_i2.p1  ORF type:complete len:460 (+),score=137.71 TRINITY_DN16431_c0_g1_i2:63-1382(+)
MADGEVILISDEEEEHHAAVDEDPPGSDDEADAAAVKGALDAGEAGRLSVLSQYGDSQVGSATYAPWRTDRDLVAEQRAAEKAAEAARGVIDGNSAICSKHFKKRLLVYMQRDVVPRGAPVTFSCIPTSQCTTTAAPGAPSDRNKRYYGESREKQQLKRRVFRKVCWVCGLGEHERHACPNKLCPDTAAPTQRDTRYSHNAFAEAWHFGMHKIAVGDMTESECIVCGKAGAVNCCAGQVSTPASCARCFGVGHGMDECNVNLRTNYHGRPGQAAPPQPYFPSPQGYGTPPGPAGAYGALPPPAAPGKLVFPQPGAAPFRAAAPQTARRPPPQVLLLPPVVVAPESMLLPAEVAMPKPPGAFVPAATPPPIVPNGGGEYTPAPFRPGGRGAGRGYTPQHLQPQQDHYRPYGGGGWKGGGKGGGKGGKGKGGKGRSGGGRW